MDNSLERERTYKKGSKFKETFWELKYHWLWLLKRNLVVIIRPDFHQSYHLRKSRNLSPHCSKAEGVDCWMGTRNDNWCCPCFPLPFSQIKRWRRNLPRFPFIIFAGRIPLPWKCRDLNSWPPYRGNTQTTTETSSSEKTTSSYWSLSSNSSERP